MAVLALLSFTSVCGLAFRLYAGPPGSSWIKSLFIRDPLISRQPEVAYVLNDLRVIGRSDYSVWTSITYEGEVSNVLGTVLFLPSPRMQGLLYPTSFANDEIWQLSLNGDVRLSESQTKQVLNQFADNLESLRSHGMTFDQVRIHAMRQARHLPGRHVASGYALNAALLASVVLLFYSSVQFWRSRSIALASKVCSACGYSREGLDRVICPECGRVLSS